MLFLSALARTQGGLEVPDLDGFEGMRSGDCSASCDAAGYECAVDISRERHWQGGETYPRVVDILPLPFCTQKGLYVASLLRSQLENCATQKNKLRRCGNGTEKCCKEWRASEKLISPKLTVSPFVVLPRVPELVRKVQKKLQS